MHILKEMEINCKKPQIPKLIKNIIFFSLSLDVSFRYVLLFIWKGDVRQGRLGLGLNADQNKVTNAIKCSGREDPS